MSSPFFTCQISDPSFSKDIQFYYNQCKTINDIQHLISKVLRIDQSQFIIENLQNENIDFDLNGITIKIKIVSRRTDVEFCMPNKDQIIIPNCYNMKYRDVINRFNEYNIHSSTNIKNRLSFLISGKSTLHVPYPFFAVPPGSIVEVTTSGNFVVLVFSQKKFILSEDDYVNDAYVLIYNQFKAETKFNLISIMNNNKRLHGGHALRKTESYTVKIMCPFDFRILSDPYRKSYQLFDYFDKVSDAKQRLAVIFFDGQNNIKSENIVIYGKDQKEVTDDSKFLREIKDNQDIIFFYFIFKPKSNQNKKKTTKQKEKSTSKPIQGNSPQETELKKTTKPLTNSKDEKLTTNSSNESTQQDEEIKEDSNLLKSSMRKRLGKSYARSHLKIKPRNPDEDQEERPKKDGEPDSKRTKEKNPGKKEEELADESKPTIKIDFVFEEREEENFRGTYNINTAIEEIEEEISKKYELEYDKKVTISYKEGGDKISIDRKMTLEDVIDEMKEKPTPTPKTKTKTKTTPTKERNVLYIRVIDKPKPKPKSMRPFRPTISKPKDNSSSDEEQQKPKQQPKAAQEQKKKTKQESSSSDDEDLTRKPEKPETKNKEKAKDSSKPKQTKPPKEEESKQLPKKPISKQKKGDNSSLSSSDAEEEEEKEKVKPIKPLKPQVKGEKQVKKRKEPSSSSDEEKVQPKKKNEAVKGGKEREKRTYYYQTNQSDDIESVSLEFGSTVKDMKTEVGRQHSVDNLSNIKILFAGANLLNDIIVDDLNIGDTPLYIYIRTIEDILLMTAKGLRIDPEAESDNSEEEEEEEEKEENKSTKSHAITDKSPNIENEGEEKRIECERKPKLLDTTTMDQLLQKKQKIGVGASSTVYRVKNTITGEGFLAVKIFNNLLVNTATKEKKDFWDDDDDNFDEEEQDMDDIIPIELIRPILREWEILTYLDHPNIIKTYGFYCGDASHPPAIVLEYCKYNLENSIVHLENIDLVRIVYEICSAIQYLHKQNIIHRDIKVNNILINKQKNAKVCDFGISRLVDAKTLTTMTHGIGTFIYMAPELFDENSKYDEKVDVYAFGVVLYFIVTGGHLPKISHNAPLERCEIPRNVTDLSKSIIKKCLSYSSKDRPSFDDIIRMMVDDQFNLFDGIKGTFSSLGIKQ